MYCGRPGTCLPFFTVSTNCRKPLLNLRRSTGALRLLAASPWQLLQMPRNQDRPSLIALTSPDIGLISGMSASAAAVEPTTTSATADASSETAAIERATSSFGALIETGSYTV